MVCIIKLFILRLSIEAYYIGVRNLSEFLVLGSLKLGVEIKLDSSSPYLGSNLVLISRVPAFLSLYFNSKV